MPSRRNFIKNMGAASLATAMPLAARGRPNFRDKSATVNVGLIGVRGMGWADLGSFLKNPETECIALCDVDKALLGQRAGEIEMASGRRPASRGQRRSRT